MRLSRPTLFVLALAVPTASQQRLAILDAPLVVEPPDQRLDHLLDWNGDGLMDFVAFNQSTTGEGFVLSVNDGHGAFYGHGGFGFGRSGPPYTDSRSHFETCDLNGDRRQDLLWVEPSVTFPTFYPGFLNVFESAQNALGMQRLPYLDYEGPIDLGTILDADHDGDPDRVRVHGLTLTLDLFARNGATWVATSSTLTLPFQPEVMLRMDCDGDDYTDLYLQGGTQGLFVPLRDGQLHTPIVFTHGIHSMMPMPIAGDVDGDGDQDLAIFDMTGYALYRRTGPASWSLEPRRAGGPAVKFVDVDGDGDLDGVCCGGGGSYAKYFDNPSTFRISLNDGTGNFAPAFTIPGLGSHEIAGAADLDGDGDVDLVAGQCIYFARGPLTHPPQRALPAAQSTRSLMDFDRDGDVDFTPGTGTFARNLGNGASRPFTLLCPPPPAGQSEMGPGLPGDWDGDGDVDLIVRRMSGTTFVDMHLLLNEGGGSYADGGVAGTENFLSGVAEVGPDDSFAVDLDLDGDLDLVTFWRAVPSTLSWTKTWLNDGQGHLSFAWGRPGWALGFGALYGSSAPDALIVLPSQNAYLFPGNGDGTFQATSVMSFLVSTTLGATSVALVDLDHDGDVDLAGAFQFGSVYYEGRAWFIPNVGGSLSLADGRVLDALESGDSRPTPRVALAGDIDGDGLEDLLFSSPWERRSAVSIVLRSPDDQGWLSPVRQVVYPMDPQDETNVVAVPGALVDIDGDGDADLVTDVIWTSTAHSAHDSGSRRQDTSGIPDLDGRVPTLGASGPFGPGDPAVLHLSGVPAGAVGMLSLQGVEPGSKAVTLPGRFKPMLPFQTGGPSAPGAGSWSSAFNVPAAVAGLRHVLRADVIDPVSGRLLRSNELELDFGR